MTKRNSRRRWIAFALIALLLAFLAWRNGTVPTAAETKSLVDPNASGPPRAATANRPPSHSRAVPDGYASPAHCDRDFKRNLRDYRAQLAIARTADEALDQLLLDVLAARPRDWASGAISRAYEVARKRWPDDLALSWLGPSLCGRDCDQNAQVRHLLAADPDNAASWMVAMVAARSDRDEAGFAHALQRAADAKIYDSRIGVVFLHVRTLLGRVPVPDRCRSPQLLAGLRRDVGREPTDDDFRNITAFSLESAIGMPAVSGIALCIPRRATPPLPDTQRRQCNALLSRVAQGDTLAERKMAVSGLLRLETDPARLAQWRERYRQLEWLQAAMLGKPLPQHDATRVWSQGEVATMQALAVERGLWPPPPDWLPDDPRARASILGGPPPP